MNAALRRATPTWCWIMAAALVAALALGADGLCFDKQGNAYVGNFAGGTVHKIEFDADGNFVRGFGDGLFERVHVADRPAYLTALADAAAQRQDRSVEFRIRRGGGADVAVGTSLVRHDDRRLERSIWLPVLA